MLFAVDMVLMLCWLYLGLVVFGLLGLPLFEVFLMVLSLTLFQYLANNHPTGVVVCSRKMSILIVLSPQAAKENFSLQAP